MENKNKLVVICRESGQTPETKQYYRDIAEKASLELTVFDTETRSMQDLATYLQEAGMTLYADRSYGEESVITQAENASKRIQKGNSTYESEQKTIKEGKTPILREILQKFEGIEVVLIDDKEPSLWEKIRGQTWIPDDVLKFMNTSNAYQVLRKRPKPQLLIDELGESTALHDAHDSFFHYCDSQKKSFEDFWERAQALDKKEFEFDKKYRNGEMRRFTANMWC